MNLYRQGTEILDAVMFAQTNAIRINPVVFSVPGEDIEPVEKMAWALNRPLVKILVDDAPLVDLFCRKYNVTLLGLSVDGSDFPATGLMYYFNDGEEGNPNGGYSRKGLENSL